MTDGGGEFEEVDGLLFELSWLSSLGILMTDDEGEVIGCCK
jgi:hypothetical protein